MKILVCKMSGKRDSNPRPLAWEANALPTELLPHSGDKSKEEFPFLMFPSGIFETGQWVDAPFSPILNFPFRRRKFSVYY